MVINIIFLLYFKIYNDLYIYAMKQNTTWLIEDTMLVDTTGVT